MKNLSLLKSLGKKYFQIFRLIIRINLILVFFNSILFNIILEKANGLIHSTKNNHIVSPKKGSKYFCSP